MNVTRLMYVERYSHVMHIVSQVQGRVRNGMDAFDLLRATFPAGTLSGAPKVKLRSTHTLTLEFVALKNLEAHAIDK